MMKYKFFTSILAMLIAAGMIAAGLIVPGMLLEKKQNTLLESNSVVKIDALEPYNPEENSPARFRKLAAMAADIFQSENMADEAYEIRGPLDTELSDARARSVLIDFCLHWLKSAVEHTVVTFNFSMYYDMYGVVEEKHKDIKDESEKFDVEVYSDTETEMAQNGILGDSVQIKAKEEIIIFPDGSEMSYQDVIEGFVTDVGFYVSPTDPTLSLWVYSIESPVICASICIDAVTGIPIAVIQLDNQGKENEKLETYREVYNALYASEFNFGDVSWFESTEDCMMEKIWDPEWSLECISGDFRLKEECYSVDDEYSQYVSVFRLLA